MFTLTLSRKDIETLLNGGIIEGEKPNGEQYFIGVDPRDTIEFDNIEFLIKNNKKELKKLQKRVDTLEKDVLHLFSYRLEHSYDK